MKRFNPALLTQLAGALLTNAQSWGEPIFRVNSLPGYRDQDRRWMLKLDLMAWLPSEWRSNRADARS